jgi:hypothetical protein
MTFSSQEVLEHLKANKPWRDWPSRSDGRYVDGLLWPNLKPSFRIDPSSKPAIFTIGSCFARHIETALARLGFELPTRQFVTPTHELAGRGPHDLLNEFNAGTMSQRILYGLNNREFDEQTLVPLPSGLTAELLLVHGADVTWERALERRREVHHVYRQLARCEYLLITLGLSEAWYDNGAGLYLNRMPPLNILQADPARYSLRKLEAEDSYALLEPAIAALVDLKVNVLLTVSPVPLNVTMTASDVVVANESSKAALRVCAERLCRRFRHVDYCPTYEIVRSGGLASYGDDNLHVKPAVIHRVTEFIAAAYCSSPADAQAA